MVALPPAEATQIGDLGPDALSAYNVCLDFERDGKTDDEVMRARLLGYLILHAPSLNSRREVVDLIRSCGPDYATLSELGQSFIYYFIRPLKTHRRRTPVSSDSPSRRSVNKDMTDWMATIKEAPRDHKEAKKQALIRDGFRCVVSGRFDIQGTKIPSIDKEEMRRVGALYTKCVHIVPESTCLDVFATPTPPETNSESRLAEKTGHSASVLAILTRFVDSVENLKGPKVHSLFNVMTMEYNMYDWFDRLDMWLEATEVVNCYRVMTVDEFFHVPEKTTLTSSNPTALPVPSPELLALHAACAKVAHLSGAGEYIDKLDRDAEELDVLACDGGSSDVLIHALLRSTTRPLDDGA